MESALFYIFSALSILSAFFVVFASRPTRSLLSLIVVMFSLAVLFLLLGAYFVAMVHIIVYAGAVLVLFLFVIMMQGVGSKDIPLFQRFKGWHLILSGITGLVFIGSAVCFFRNQHLGTALGVQGTVENVGLALFQDYLLPFELISILLLIGVFAAVALAKKEDA